MLRFTRSRICALCCAWTLAAVAGVAQSQIQGAVTDPSGAAIPQAKVELLAGARTLASTHTNAEGRFRFERPSQAAQSLRVSAAGFGVTVKKIDQATQAPIEIRLAIAAIPDQVVVVASGMPTLLSQTGATVATLNQQSFTGTQQIGERLRMIAGLQSNQVGQIGGTTGFFLRGGKADATKVLIDGAPANDIGGKMEFANLTSAGIGRVEVLRGPNSVLYGADAMAGVIRIDSPRGATAQPTLAYSAGGGNFGSYYQEGQLSGKHGRFDHYTNYSRFDTRNAIPNNASHMGTAIGNYGYSVTPNNSLRATIRHNQDATDMPNALLLYGVPSNAVQRYENAYFGLAWEGQASPRWRYQARYSGIRLRSNYSDRAPVGEVQYRDTSKTSMAYPTLCTPSAAMPTCVAYNTIGAPVTLAGANGYSVSGRAYYKSVYRTTYPTQYPVSTDKDFVQAQSDYRLLPNLRALLAFQYENERGYSSKITKRIERHNYDYTLELDGDLRSRLFYVLGAGVEKNGLFGLQLTPRAALAWQASPSTKLRASFGKGVKEPALSDQLGSLYSLLQSYKVCGALHNESCAYLIPQYNITPIGPQRSRSYDGGVDQLLFSSRLRASLTAFHNTFSNGIEYAPSAGLIAIGIPAQVVAAANSSYSGAMVNSLDYRARGAEAEVEAQLSHGWFARGGYTYTDAKVLHSFTSDAMGPTYNTAFNFATTPIGAYSPLVGARPFRLAPHTGYVQAGYRDARLYAALSGSLVSSRDDSTFLVDSNGGSSLLLPNRNLDAAYQKFDLVSTYQLCRYAALEGSFQNLFSQHFSEAYGYPAAPFNFRLGIKFTLGGHDEDNRRQGAL